MANKITVEQILEDFSDVEMIRSHDLQRKYRIGYVQATELINKVRERYPTIVPPLLPDIPPTTPATSLSLSDFVFIGAVILGIVGIIAATIWLGSIVAGASITTLLIIIVIILLFK